MVVKRLFDLWRIKGSLGRSRTRGETEITLEGLGFWGPADMVGSWDSEIHPRSFQTQAGL